jgi:cell wall-associated NlpC family hydrolase
MLLRRGAPLAVLARYALAGLLVVGVAAAVLAHTLRPGGSHAASGSGGSRVASHAGAPARRTGPVLSLAAPRSRSQQGPTSILRVRSANTHPARRSLAVEQPDPYAAVSFPVAHSTHAAAVAPATAGSVIAPGAPSDAQVQQELAQMQAATSAQNAQSATSARGGSIGGSGTVTPPAGVPAVVARVIAGANAIADFPYVYGGGHGSFVDNAYDCSGSVSYALAAGGLVSIPETSGELESWGAPGPGKWITVEANAGHTYMYVAGLRFDTAGRSGPYSSRWQRGILADGGFVTRHYPGL